MRKEALAWWRQLSYQEKVEKAKKHFPNHSFLFVTTSSLFIEQTFRKELQSKQK